MEAVLSLVVTLVVVAVSLLFTVVITLVSLAIPGAILYMFYKANAEKQRVLREGKPAVGLIVSARQTGAFVNNNPQVQLTIDVQPLDGEPYQAQATTVVSMIALPRIQPGQTVDLKYDENDRNNIAIVGL